MATEDESPVVMPPVPIFEIGLGGYFTGETADIAYDAGCPTGWTREAPPALGPGQFAVFDPPFWRVTDEEHAPPTPSLAQLKADRLEAIRELRWRHETAGITVGGTTIRTDERSQGKLSGAVILFLMDPEKTSIDSWEAEPGVFVTLPKVVVMATARAVGDHVQACFDHSKLLTAEIMAAATVEALEAVNIEAGWPE